MVSEFEAIVIGAGVAGAGVASELASDRTVILLEQEAQPGMHATGRSAALYSEVYGNPCIRQLTRASRSFFLESSEGQAFATPRGCLHIATRQQLDRLSEFAEQPTVVNAVDRIEGSTLQTLIPVLRSDVVVAALAERNAYDLDVDAIHHHFLKHFRQAGGTLHCSTGVTALEHDGSAWAVTAGGRQFRAPIIINAAGAWGDEIAALAGVSQLGLKPLRRTALLVDPPQGMPPSSWPATIDIDEQFYFKPEAGKVLLSPADETPMAPCDAYPDELDLAIAVDRVQQVADIPVDRISHSWAGLRTFTPDRTPAIGYDTSAPGFFWLVGQGGYGIQTSPAVSRLAAALVRGQDIPSDLLALDFRQAAVSPCRFRHSAGASHSLITDKEIS